MRTTKKTDDKMRENWNQIQKAAVEKVKKEGKISDEEMDQIDARAARSLEEMDERIEEQRARRFEALARKKG